MHNTVGMISPELLFSESHRQAFCSGSDLERQCAELLEGYRDWWLRGGERRWRKMIWSSGRTDQDS